MPPQTTPRFWMQVVLVGESGLERENFRMSCRSFGGEKCVPRMRRCGVAGDASGNNAVLQKLHFLNELSTCPKKKGSQNLTSITGKS